MESDKLIETLFDKKTLSILKLFLNKKDQEFCLKEVSKYTKVPLASTHRILKKMVLVELLEIQKTKHLKIYRLIQNEKTRVLENMFQGKKTILDEFVDAMNKIEHIKTVMLYGKEEKDKANILLIGEGIDNNPVREVIVRIKEKYNFTITHLSLTEQQYSQMAAMNLYPGKKDILLEK